MFYVYDPENEVYLTKKSRDGDRWTRNIRRAYGWKTEEAAQDTADRVGGGAQVVYMEE